MNAHLHHQILGAVTLPLALLCACGTPTPAARTPRKATPTHVRVAASARQIPLLRDAARPHLQLDLVDARSALETMAAAKTPAADLAAARAALARARDAYKQLHFTAAITTLQTAQEALVAATRRPQDFATLGEIALWRGITHLALKQNEAARQAIGWALTLGQHGGGGRFAPEVQRFIEEVEKTRGRGSLTIDALPSGAKIWLDGEARGTAPATLSLGGGLHHVRIGRLGYRPRVLLPLVKSGQVDRLSVSLERAPPAEIARQLLDMGEPTPAANGRQLAALIGVDAAVTISGGGSKTTAKIAWLQKGAPIKPSLTCSGNSPRSLSACIADALFVMATGHAPPRPAGPPATTAFYRRWWFWTAVGGAVAAGTGVAVYAGTRGSRGVDVFVESKK